jgi:hypothetical protein
MQISRRAFQGGLLAAAAAGAAAADQGKVELPEWKGEGGGESFDLPTAPLVRERWKVTGLPRKYFDEWLSALFERTLAIDEWKTPATSIEWIFTGPDGGFTIHVGAGKLRVSQRYYDSPGLGKTQGARHPEAELQETTAEYSGNLRAITVVMDHRLGLRVLLNGKDVIAQHCLIDVNRHQAALAGEEGGARCRMLPRREQSSSVRVNPHAGFQKMLGWGGTTTPPAYRELGEEGQRQWWHKVAEYNLLLQREYPVGALLNREMTNWDRPADASPHYYGDNFPNCETSDFEYNRHIRRMGGKIIFEFWELPVWARQRDSNGKLTEAPIIDEYTKAMVGYCKTAREKTGAPPEIVGIQNEVKQAPEVWQQMALALRKALDDAGFQAVRIHMHNPPFLADGIKAAQAFREKPEVWKTIDYATSNMYDYQNFFYDPDGFDERLREMKAATEGKMFLAGELCVNNTSFQTRSYRTAFAMGQLYHKVLTELDACGVMYCWTLLNVTQPSYGWTRSLMVPDPEHGFIPAASSHQLRVFGAWSRRIREGMTRVAAQSSNPELLATAFAGKDGEATVVLVNRTPAHQKVAVSWPGAQFRYLELADPQFENIVFHAPAGHEGAVEVTVHPGAIVTLSNVDLLKGEA